MTRTPAPMSVSEGRAMLYGRELFAGSATTLIDELQNRIDAGHRELVVTPNVDQVVLVSQHRQARTAYEASSLRLVDGQPLAWLARFLGATDIERHTGADLLQACARESADRRWNIVIAGGHAATADLAAATLRDQYLGSSVVAVHLPFSDDLCVTPETARRIADSEPDIVFVCMGFPKQELWYLHNVDDLPPAIYIGAGAAIDFAAGQKRRAPRWMQVAGLEWLYRLAQEPRRLAHRYLVQDVRFIGIAANSILKGKK